MKKARKDKSHALENRKGGKFPARRLYVPVLFAFIFLASLLITVTLFSENAEAQWGIDVEVQSPKDKYMETATKPQSVLFTIDVTNTGQNQESINLTLTFNDPGKPAAGWTVNPATRSINNLGSGVKQSFQVQVTAPDGEPAFTSAQLTVYGYVKDDPTENDQDTFIARVTPEYDVNIEIVGSVVKNADQGGQVTYNFIVNNTGNAQDTIQLSATGLPTDPEWFAMFAPEKANNLNSGASLAGIVTFSIPTPVENTTYPITIVASSEGDPSETDSRSTFTNINAEYLLTISIPSPNLEGLPGNNVQYNITVENLGNTDDLVTPGIANLEGNTWTTILDKTQQVIPFQASRTWVLTVQIPDEAKDWERGKVKFNATSENLVYVVDTTTITDVGKVYGINVFIPDSTNATDPDATVYYPVQITNTGNTNDTITLTTSGEFESRPIPQQLLNLLPDTPTDVILEVDIPDDALAGFHYNAIIATSKGDNSVSHHGNVSTNVNPVYNVSISSSGSSSQEGEPGGATVYYTVKVNNKGTADDTILLDLEGEKWNWAGLDNYAPVVPAKSFIFVTMTVNVPSGEPINTWTIIVNGTSEEDSDAWDTEIFEIRVNQTYEVSASTGENSNPVPEGGSTKYYIDVKNRGSGYDDFKASYWAEDILAATWPSVSPARFGLHAGENTTVELTINVPSGTDPGIFNIWFNVTSENESKSGGLVRDTQLTITEVTQSYEVLIAGGKEQSGESPPDSTITYVIEIYNTGTGEDSFVLEKMDAESNHPSWASLSENFTGILQPQEKYILWVNITIPDQTGGDTLDYLNIKVISQGDPALPPADPAYDLVWINTTITPTREAKLTPPKNVYYREPDDVIVVNLKLKNTGTATDVLTVTDISPAPYDSWGEISLTNNSMTLAPDQEVNLTYTITVASDVTLDDSPIRLKLAVNSTGADDDAVEFLEIKIEINQTYDVTIRTIQDTKPGDPGEEISYEVKIINDGNGNDTIAFSHIGDELGQWSVSDIDLIPDEFIFVYYNITIDSQHNTSDILVTLKASSTGDDTGMTFDLLNITIDVEPRYEVKLGVNGTNQKKVKGGQSAIFNLTIQNRGTATDIYDIEPLGTTGFWATPETLLVTLDPNEKTIIQILVQPPEGTEVKIHNITINVASQEDSSAQDNYTFYADVEASYKLFLSTSTPQQKVDAGQTATFTGVKIQNDGNAQDTFTFYITNMTAGWSHSPLSSLSVPAGESVSFNIDVTTTQQSASGVYELYLTAVSEGDSTKQQSITLIVEVQQIYGVDMTDSVSSKNVDINNFITYIIDVKNTGNGEDNVELKLTGDVEPWTWLNSSTGNGTTIQVSPPSGGSVSVYLYIAPPDDYWDTWDGSVQLTVLAESLDDPDINPADDLLDVSTTVNPEYGAKINPTGTFTTGDPGELKQFTFTIENTGTVTDGYNIRVDDIDTGTGGDESLWLTAITFSPSSISGLGSGTISSPIQINVNIPDPSDLAKIPPGRYNITVEITSTGDSDIKDFEIFEVDVQQIFEADVQNTVTTETVNVGESVIYSITIKNKGNDADMLSVELEGDGDIPGSVNWGKLSHSGTAQTDKQVLTDILLNAGESTDIELKISIPLRTDPGYPTVDPDDVTLKVIVKPSDDDGTEDEVLVTADINIIYEFDFNFLAKTLDVIPGELADFTIKIENRGTSSETFNYEIFQWEDDWSDLTYTFSPSQLTISGDSIGDVLLSINTPSDLTRAVSGDYNITIKVHASAGNADLFKNCTIHLEPVYEVELTTTGSTNKAVNVGSTVTYQFTIRNNGNSRETFAFSVSDMDTSSAGGGDQSTWANLYLVSDPSTPLNSVDLDSEQSEAMIFEIVVPPQGDPNFAELTATLQIKLEVNSAQEPGIKDDFITYTTINPIYSFELTTTAPQNTKEGEPGDTVSFSLQVRNTGTTLDTYEFRVTSVDESMFLISNPNTISNLGVDSYGTTTADVTVDSDNEDALAGTYQIEINANSKADPGVSHLITLTVEITPVGLVEITPSSQQITGEPEEAIDYVVKVSNKGNAEDIFDLSLEDTNKEWGTIMDADGNIISKITLNATTLPGSFAEITVRVIIPGTGETTAGNTYPITVKASSTNTEGKSDTAQVSTKVEEFVDLILDYSGSGQPKKDYDPNKKSPKFSLRATNNGNQPETGMEVRVDDMDPDWDYEPKTISQTLEAGSSLTFSIEFTIPSDESEGEYEMQVYLVTSVEGSSEESDPVFVTVNITKPDLTVGDVEMPDEDELKSKVGNQVTITATIDNQGHSKAESIQVKLYEDNSVRSTKTISSIEAEASRTVDFRWTVVADDIELEVEIIPIEEIDDGNNNYPPIFLDLRPDLTFEGEEINFSDSNPSPDDKITIKVLIKNDGGDAEDVVVKFFDGSKTIGTDTLDIDFDEVGEATYEWTVPDKSGETVTIKAEIDLDDAIGNGDESTKSFKVAGETGIGGVFTGAGLTGMLLGLAIGAILFLIIGMAIGRRRGGAARGPEGMAGPSFAAFEKEMPEGAGKKAPKAPAPFERTEEEGPAEEEEKAKPKEVARVRCPKCGKVTEVTSTQRPLQIPCECGTTLMLKK